MMNHRLVRFLQLPFWEKLNLINLAFSLLKTQTIYRAAFGSMGSRTIIRNPIMLQNTRYMHLGDSVLFLHGARLEGITERYGCVFQPKVIIGSGSSFQQNFHLTCAQEIIIGKKVAVTENVGVFDIWHPYEDITHAIVEQPLRTAPVYIGDETLIGMGAVIHPGVSIGKHCVIGANSVVTKSIPDYCVAVGVPAKVIRQYNGALGKWVSYKQSGSED